MEQNQINDESKRNPTEQSDGADQPLLGDGHGLEIKFSHKYLKLSTEKEFKEAQLIEAVKVNLKDLSKTFLDYDTDEGSFVLPKKGKFFLLIFKTEHGHVFTILRRFNEKTIDKYKRNIGEWFDIIILNDFQVL